MTNYQPKKKYLSQLRHHHQDISQQQGMEGIQDGESLQQQLHQQHLQHLQQQDNLKQQQQQLLQQQNLQQHLQQINYNRAQVDNNTQNTETLKNNDEEANKINTTNNLSLSFNHLSPPTNHLSSPSNHLSPPINHLTSPSSSLMMMNLSDPPYHKDTLNKLQQQNFNFNNNSHNNSNNYLACNNLPRMDNPGNFNRFSDPYIWSQQQQQQRNFINKNLQHQQKQLYNRNLQQQQQYHITDNNQPPTLKITDDPSIHSPHHPFIHSIHSSHPQDTISPRSTSDEMSVLNIKEELHNNNNTLSEDKKFYLNLSEDNKFYLNNNNNTLMLSPSRQSMQQLQQISPGFYNNSQGNIHDISRKSSSNENEESMAASNEASAQQQLFQQLKPLLTSSGRNKGSGKPIEPKHLCQVCGDLAAGFHCGAYVCEACKVREAMVTMV